jgi:hypothetical protein
MLSRFLGAATLTIMVLIVVLGASGFFFATTQPLDEVKIVNIRKVLASEAELLFDLVVAARNPNVMAVVVEEGNLSIYARSKKAKSDDGWWSWPSQNSMRRRGERIRSTDSVNTADDSPWDPFPPSDPSHPLLLLGRITSLDNPLNFHGSPFKHSHSISSAEARLANPGNATEGDGLEKWEKMLEDEFELIVMGVLRYELPMSRRVRTVQVDGKVRVKPDGEKAGVGEGGEGKYGKDEGTQT